MRPLSTGLQRCAGQWRFQKCQWAGLEMVIRGDILVNTSTGVCNDEQWHIPQLPETG